MLIESINIDWLGPPTFLSFVSSRGLEIRKTYTQRDPKRPPIQNEKKGEPSTMAASNKHLMFVAF